MTIEILAGEFTVCQVKDFSEVDLSQPFTFTAAADNECSLVCLSERVPQNAEARADGWRGFRIKEQLDFSLVGIMAEISGLLAGNYISIFAVSTFNTDYFFVRLQDFTKAMKVLGGTFRIAELPQETYQSRRAWLKTDLFKRIERSKFRSSFQLKEADRKYLKEKGYREIERHAAEIIASRLAAAEPANDGKQTPMRGAPKGHPVFLAQHATGTCCRGCLEKWHGIPQHRPLSGQEQKYIAGVIMAWIVRQYKAGEEKL